MAQINLPVDWQDAEAQANLVAIQSNQQPQQPISVPTKEGVLDALLGPDRYQLWPERLVRDAISAPHDVLNSKEPLTSQDLIKPALDMSALAGTGGLAGADATLGAGPFLRPALKYEGKIYKAPMGGQHMDAIPKDLQAEFTRQAMSGEDISNFNFGFMNHKGQFLDREKALQYAIDEGLLSPHDARYGALTSTMDFAKQPSNNLKDYLPAVKDLDTDKVFSGDKNSIHPGLQYQDNKFLKNPKDGFVDKNGNFLTRNEFKEKFGVNESQQLARAHRYGALTSTMDFASKPQFDDPAKLMDWMPAIKVKDKIYKGQDHPTIQEKNQLYGISQTDGFVDKNGNFLNRNDFNKKFGTNESDDLNSIKEVLRNNPSIGVQ